MKQKKPKKKTCACGCRRKFIPQTSFHVAYNYKCAMKIGEKKKAAKEKKQRASDKKRLIELKPRSYWEARAQAWCNRYIRLRDKDRPCISCGNTNNVKYDSGHFITRGSCNDLRFHPMNIWKQCSKHCNSSLSGNIIEYRKALIRKIGPEMVDYLENFRQFRALTIDEIKEVEEYYKQLIKEI